MSATNGFVSGPELTNVACPGGAAEAIGAAEAFVAADDAELPGAAVGFAEFGEQAAAAADAAAAARNALRLT